ncbi:MAG: hypothetical protein CMJ16_00845 [Peredibacter sp.]|nr:hypothetical protein [Peredibacter sp.]
MLLKKYLFFIIEVLKSNLTQLRRPYKLNFVVTKSCNSKCLNCNIWQVKPRDELSLEEIEKVAISSPWLKWIDFTGGEPTNRKDFVDIVATFNRYCKNLLYVHFPTNGLRPEKIKKVVEGIKKVGTFKIVLTVSIDGPKEVNDKLRGVPGDFEKSVETYRLLNSLPGVKVYFGTTLFESNYLYINQMFKELKVLIPRLKKTDIHVNMGHYSEHFYENESSSDINPSLKIYKEIEAFYTGERGISPFSFLERIYSRGLRGYVVDKRTPMVCRSLEASVYLSEKGTVYPCSMWNRPLSNVREHDYDLGRVIDSQKALNALSEIRQNKCSQCWTPCEAYQTIIGNMFEASRL